MDKITLEMAYHRGRDARERGHYRVSPFYHVIRYIDGRTVDITKTLEHYWLAGYDQLPFPTEVPIL